MEGVFGIAKYDGLKEMYESGKTLRECAESYGVSHQMVWALLKEAGCVFRARTEYKKTPKIYEGLADMYANGATGAECALHYGKNQSTISKALKVLGVKTRKRGFPQKYASFDGAEAMYNSGATIQEVAEHFGVTAMTIHRRLRAEGFVFRNKGVRGAQKMERADNLGCK